MQEIVGFLAGFVMVRLDVARDLSFRQWLTIVKQRVLETVAFGDIPIERLRRELLRKGMLPRTTGAVFGASRPPRATTFADLTMTRLEHYSPAPAASWWRLDFNEHNEADDCELSFDPRVHDPAGVQGFVDALRCFADAASRSPDLPMRQLLAMSAIEERPAPGWTRRAGTALKTLRRRLG
jgi:non-ribosomal peptide synthetase component F